MLLHIDRLRVGYRGRAILPPVTLTVEPGDLWAVVGPNGAGKSTFLRTILGLHGAVAGEVQRGVERLGYVPQRNEVDSGVPQRVLDLVRMGAERGWRVLDPLARRRHPDVIAALRDTDTQALADLPWSRLSEGQKQRVLLAQALAGRPQLLVLDEPTSAMDVHAEADVFALLQKLQRERDLGVLVISHHLALLARHATHVLLLDQDARLALAGPAAEVLASEAFVQRYGRLAARGGSHG